MQTQRDTRQQKHIVVVLQSVCQSYKAVQFGQEAKYKGKHFRGQNEDGVDYLSWKWSVTSETRGKQSCEQTNWTTDKNILDNLRKKAFLRGGEHFYYERVDIVIKRRRTQEHCGQAGHRGCYVGKVDQTNIYKFKT